MGGAGAPKFCMLKVLCCERVSKVCREIVVVAKSWQVLVVVEGGEGSGSDEKEASVEQRQNPRFLQQISNKPSVWVRAWHLPRPEI